MLKINDIKQSDLDLMNQIDRDCHAMHLPPPPKMFANLSVTMPDGEQILEYKTKCNSFLRNGHNFFLAHSLSFNCAGNTTYEAGSLGVKRWYTATTVIPPSSYGIDAYNTAGFVEVSQCGVCVGSSSTAESFELTALDALIAHGTGAGQLSYAAQETDLSSYNTPTKTWTLTKKRYLNNNSGSAITVREIGLSILQSSNYVMLIRDVLGTEVAVPNGAQLKVEFVFTYTFPA